MTRNEAHPITVEVVRNAIVAYADEMANALSKAAYNMMIYEVRDYCCGLIDTQARMISQNRGGLPIFLADLGVAVADGIARYGLKGFAPGALLASVTKPNALAVGSAASSAGMSAAPANRDIRPSTGNAALAIKPLLTILRRDILSCMAVPCLRVGSCTHFSPFKVPVAT